MLNDFEKLHALFVSDRVRVWHYPQDPYLPPYAYWLAREDWAVGHRCPTLAELLAAAYAEIDPLALPLAPPEEVHADDQRA